MTISRIKIKVTFKQLKVIIYSQTVILAWLDDNETDE